jgi:hypothetical protein
MIPHLELGIAVAVGDDLEQTARAASRLRAELRERELGEVRSVPAAPTAAGTKAVDPVTLGALVLAVAPAIVEKFLEFLHEWTQRDVDRRVKIKVQSTDGAALEVDVPMTESREELRAWIEFVKTSLAAGTAQAPPGG